MHEVRFAFVQSGLMEVRVNWLPSMHLSPLLIHRRPPGIEVAMYLHKRQSGRSWRTLAFVLFSIFRRFLLEKAQNGTPALRAKYSPWAVDLD